MPTPFPDGLDNAIRQIAGSRTTIHRLTEVGGGSISRAFVAETDHGKWFIKLNQADLLDLFEAEADGLRALSSCPELQVPGVFGTGTLGAEAFIALECMEFRPLRNQDGRAAGRALAALHRIAGTEFGWHRANYIGSTPQSNRLHEAWPDFFANERLCPQLALAERHGHSQALIEGGMRLSENLSAFFTTHSPIASLLHGDLWSGNAACDARGRLVVVDPAVYHGDREADLAMTELFGGFPAGFRDAYRDDWPLADGYAQRRTLYNLYHVLNHLNLFGGGYLHQAERMIDTLLAELG